MLKLRRRLKAAKYCDASDEHRPRSGAVLIQLYEVGADEDSPHFVNTESLEKQHESEIVDEAKCK